MILVWKYNLILLPVLKVLYYGFKENKKFNVMHVHFAQLKTTLKNYKEQIQDWKEINGKLNFQQYVKN